MRFATDVDDSVARLADRFVRLVTEGRGDGARGRNLYVLRFFDAMGDPQSTLHLPYRPTRNPGAFLAMLFDLAGDALYGYSTGIEGGAEHSIETADGVRRHLIERLTAPWGRFAVELESAGLPHLAAVTCETVESGLQRPTVSDLPALLDEFESWMTIDQHARFDADRFVDELPFHRVLSLLRYDGASEAVAGSREQHASGGDLRALVRRRLDRPWRRAIECERVSDPIAFLASWPFDVTWLLDQACHEDFAVAYALATDANRPGRHWAAPSPYVGDEEREAFEALAGRGAAGAVRRERRLQRWGVSATFPTSTEAVDDRLEDAAIALPALHARAPWHELVATHRDALEVARRRFVQRVADAVDAGAPP